MGQDMVATSYKIVLTVVDFATGANGIIIIVQNSGCNGWQPKQFAVVVAVHSGVVVDK